MHEWHVTSVVVVVVDVMFVSCFPVAGTIDTKHYSLFHHLQPAESSNMIHYLVYPLHPLRAMPPMEMMLECVQRHSFTVGLMCVKAKKKSDLFW